MGLSLSKIKNIPPGITETEDFYIVNNVKIFKFPTKPLITTEQDEDLRSDLTYGFSRMFSNFLKKNINMSEEDKQKFNICTESLKIPLFMFYDPTTKALKTFDEKKKLTSYAFKNPIFSAKKIVEKLKQNNFILDKPQSDLGENYFEEKFVTNSLFLLKEEFKDCNYFQYFIPLVVFNIDSKVSHQNLLLINKNDQVVTWIEPQFDSKIIGTERVTLIRNTINTLLDFLIQDKKIRQEYQIDYPAKICPQAITLDKNCMFWSFLLAMELVINNNSTIDEVSEAMLKKFPDKKSLSEYMNNFKVYVSEFAKDGGKRRKTIRRKVKKSRTRRSI